MRLMIILVNAFAILSLVFYLLNKISPIAFLTYSGLWILLMVSIWFILPFTVYSRASTFKHRFTMYFNENDFTLEHERGKRSWPYSELSTYKETPHFFHLYYDPRSFLLVPKDAFPDLESLQQLREILKTRI